MEQVAKPYDWTQFRLRIWIQAPPSEAFREWTEPKEIVKWFTVKATFEARTGGTFSLTWLAGDTLEGKVTRLVKNRLVQFPFGSKGEEVAVSFRKSKSGTICEIHQFGMKTAPRDKVAMHMGCIQGWTFFLANLKAWLEQGQDLRSHDPRQSYRQQFVNS